MLGTVEVMYVHIEHTYIYIYIYIVHERFDGAI